MARLYSNENFPLPAVVKLRSLGHDVLTIQETGQANQSLSDEEVLAFSIREDRILLTFNRKHFIKLHRQYKQHPGIVVCTFDPDFDRLALQIHTAIQKNEKMEDQLVRINRPRQ